MRIIVSYGPLKESSQAGKILRCEGCIESPKYPRPRSALLLITSVGSRAKMDWPRWKMRFEGADCVNAIQQRLFSAL